MSIRQAFMLLIAIALNLALIRFLWWIGFSHVLSFILGVFIGAMVVLYWASSKNMFMTALLQTISDDLKGDPVKRGDKKNDKSGKKKK